MKQILIAWALRHLPESLLAKAMNIRKSLRRKTLQLQSKRQPIRFEQIIEDLRKIGIQNGDSVLVHSSLSKIGYVEGGAPMIIRALRAVVGERGTILMPSFPATGRNKDYLETQPIFDVLKTPSNMGIISEVFRKTPGVLRSLHPTDPVCAEGPLASYYINTHFGQPTPYNAFSPFRKLIDKKGKILMLGTSLNGACTSLHTLEDAVDFPYAVYDSKLFQAQLIDDTGTFLSMETRVHNPEYSALRNADALLPLFEQHGVLKKGTIGKARSFLIDAAGFFQTMINAFEEKGVTMYTPTGTR
jgi:aminoglycoside 3-N-acetyltransferase